MIDRPAALVLPLVHHLVDQGRECLGPSVATEVTAADDDLRRLLWRGDAIVAESAFETTGDSNRYRMQHAAEALGVERLVRGGETCFGRRIVRMSRLTSPSRRALFSWNRIRQHDLPRRRPLGSRAATDERGYGSQDIGRRVEKRTVDSECAATVTHHNSTITRQAQCRHAAESASNEAQQQLIGRLRPERELELLYELPRYRVTHFVGPGSNPWPFQMSDCTSTLSRVIVQTFTDCGRCPRDRLDTVPATEINMRPSVTSAS